MDGFLLARLFGEWLFGVSTLVSIINPFGTAFVFQALTRRLPRQERRHLALLVARNSFVLLLVSMVLGARLLSFFGISLEALRIAGGFVVVHAGWTMLAEEPRDAPASNGAPATSQAFFPLTMPLTTGPGSIAAAIALAADPDNRGAAGGLLFASLSACLVTATVAALVWVAYRNADTLARWLGPDGTLVATKLSAFLLLCVGVQIMLAGGESVLARILADAG
ncbi:membrane protein, MarC family [Acetobacteraceae bacterium AT-5844]|nr:membrane protein, MarC family [Acetobacteraceae bacterium AT-5844]